jgi:hypothetical protein
MAGTKDLLSSKFNTIQRQEQLPAAAATMEKLCGYIEISIHRCADSSGGQCKTDIGNVMDGTATIGIYTINRTQLASLKVTSHTNATVTFSFTTLMTGLVRNDWKEQGIPWSEICGQFATINRIGFRIWKSFVTCIKIPWGMNPHIPLTQPLAQKQPTPPATIANTARNVAPPPNKKSDQPASSSSGTEMMKNMAVMMAEMAKMLSQKIG